MAALEAAGATVKNVGSFSPDPLRGEGILLCVDGQEVRIYAYPSEEDRAEDASRIDPTDPSNFGTTMVTWAGSPRFWQGERLIVLYLGGKPAIEAGLTSVLGEPFARADGRGPAQARNDC